MRSLIILLALGGCTVNNYYGAPPAPATAQKPSGGTYTNYAYPDPNPPKTPPSSASGDTNPNFFGRHGDALTKQDP
jgi:hypothetical protein